MPEYRRAIIAGGTYFFTVVTYNRLPILANPDARRILRTAWSRVQAKYPFRVDAICLLPEHIHTIWTMPDGDGNFSLRWKEIKRLFSTGFLQEIGPGETRNASRLRSGEAAIWQRRFWEHMIRDEKDLNRHLDYIHYNPVKHGLVNRAADWEWSSFHRYAKMGFYENNWGETPVEEIQVGPGME